MQKKDFQKQIIREIEKQLKVKVAGIIIPPQGMDSKVFFAVDSSGKEYAIKYGNGVIGDILAYKLLEENKVDILVPKILSNFEIEGKTVLILEKFNFPLLESIPTGSMHKYIPSKIKNLKKIHQIKSKRAGLLYESGKGRIWKEIMLAKFNGKDSALNWHEIAKRDGLDSGLVLKSVENITKRINVIEFTEGEYSFLHTDFNQRNLFVNPDLNEIAGIIDWSEAMFGDPVYDFARVRMYIWHFNLESKVLTNYYKLVSFTPEQKQLEELYWLYRIIEYLAYYSEELNDFNVGRIKLHQDFLRDYKWGI